MTYHQLLYFLEKDYFLKFTSLKGQLENKGKDTMDANYGLRKFKPLERHPTLDIPISTEEENQENLRISAICKENLLKIREEKKQALEDPDSASNDSSDKRVPEMVMRYEDAVRALSGGHNG